MTMTDLEVSLGAIEEALEKLGRVTLLTSMRAGIPRQELAARLGEVGLTATPELEVLYRWHDGTSTDGVEAVDDIQLLPGFYLPSTVDAVANYRAFLKDARWRTGWLPFLANGGGDFYVVELANSSRGSVRHFRIDEIEHPVEFGSVAQFFATVAAAYANHIIYVDDADYLEMDDRLFAELAERMNPDIAWWRSS